MTIEKVERRLPFYQGKVAAAGAAVAVFYWFAETGAHAWIFRTGSFSNELFHGDSNELWMRSFTFCLLLLSAFVLQGYLHRIRRTVERTRLLARAVEQAGEAILITNATGIIEYVNPAFERVTGYVAREVLGKPPSVLKSGAMADSVYKQLWETIKSGAVWQGQITDRRKDGSYYPASLTIAPVFDSGGALINYVGIQLDRSEQMELQQALQQAQKLEALGTLVGGIAHDFNNVLATILVHTELGVMKAADPAQARRSFERIQTAASGAAGMVNQLMSFVRRRRPGSGPELLQDDTPAPSALELSRCLSNLRPILEAVVDPNVELEFQLPDAPVLARIASHQLQEISLNLLKNGSDACREVVSPRVTLCLRQEADTVLIRVEDNGPGVPEALVDRIFEPFFTTKPPGEGTGLGLAMVYDIARSVEATLILKQAADTGAAFELRLPAAAAEATEPSGASGSSAGVAGFAGFAGFDGRGRRVLLADDQPLYLETAAALLASLGFEVEAVPGGNEALEVVAQRRRASGAESGFDLVILDVTMPTLDGVETARRLRVLEPALPILLCTGYDHGLVEGGSPVDASLPVLEKPFDLEQLCAKLGALLELASK